ncbi:MAG: hypothetical protein JWN98_1556 [Abditibacteriota bacterium]|nr:hypothetical protein [Abditibacteriota bacterium]
MKHDWHFCDGHGFESSETSLAPQLSAAVDNTAVEASDAASLKMTRRQALLGGALATIGWAATADSALADVAFEVAESSRERAARDEVRPVLVTLFLRGGADGLNMIVPYGDGDYLKLRPTIGIAAPAGRLPVAQTRTDRTLDLDGFFGLHPALSPLHALFRDGNLACVHACGSNDDSRSHFEAMATVECGRAGASTQSTLGAGTTGGWLARHLASMPSPTASPLRAVAFGSTMPELLRGATNATAIESLSDFHLRLPGLPTAEHDEVRDALAALYRDGRDEIARAGRETLGVLKTINRLDPARYTPQHGASYPDSQLGRGMKQVACLLRARVGLEVACLDRGGWDTHIAQGGSAGWMALQMADVAQSLAAFARDLRQEMRRVTVVVMSEFGRRAGENSGLGTDHGRGGAMMIMGGVRGGKVYGRWPGLAPHQLETPGDLRVTTDYRDVLCEILARRIGNIAAQRVFPGHRERFLDMVKTE